MKKLRRISLFLSYYTSSSSSSSSSQWRRHTREYQGKCSGRNTSPLATALAVKSGNNKIIYQNILTALADATNALPMPCLEQRTGAATVFSSFSSFSYFISESLYLHLSSSS